MLRQSLLWLSWHPPKQSVSDAPFSVTRHRSCLARVENLIERCKWWLDLERAFLKPDVTVILGASAARAVLGKFGTISSARGKPIATAHGQALVTLHPSALLRIPDKAERHRAY